ncbi:MAG: hypothetical protein DRO09_02865, partial [Thermoprotei archaeon]
MWRKSSIGLVAIAILLILAMAGCASAALQNLAWTDGNDEVYFIGQNDPSASATNTGEYIYISWEDTKNSTSVASILVVNTSGTTSLTFANASIYDGTNYVNWQQMNNTSISAYDYVNGIYKFKIRVNTSQFRGNDTKILVVGVTSKGNTLTPSSDNTTFTNAVLDSGDIWLVNYSIRLVYNGNDVDDVLAHQNLTIYVNTTIPYSSIAEDAVFKVTTNCSYDALTNTITLNTTTKNGTGYIIPITKGQNFWINITNGENGDAMRILYFNVNDLVVKTIPVNVNLRSTSNETGNFTYVYLNNGTGSGLLDFDINITMKIDRSGDELVIWNYTAPSNNVVDRFSANQPFNITLLSRTVNETYYNYTGAKIAIGNATYPIKINTSSTPGTGHLYAYTNVTGNYDWGKDYEVVKQENVTITTTCPIYAWVNDTITLQGSFVTIPEGYIYVNISYVNATGATIWINNSTATLDLTAHEWTYNWNTNWTWLNGLGTDALASNAVGAFLTNPMKFTVYVSVNGSLVGDGNYTTCEIYLYDNLTTTTDAEQKPFYSTLGGMYINGTFNVTVESTRPNGTWINLTIYAYNSTGVAKYINVTANDTINNYNATLRYSNVTIPINLTDSYAWLLANFSAWNDDWWGTNGEGSKTIYILANDTAWNNTPTKTPSSRLTTITLVDKINVTAPAKAVPGQYVIISGYATRTNGTIINVTITGTNYLKKLSATVYDFNSSTGWGKWNVTWWTNVSGNPLAEGTYKIYANDSFVKTSEITIELTKAAIEFDVYGTPVEGYEGFSVDHLVYFNGTTTLSPGTVLNATVMLGDTVIANATLYANMSTTVQQDGTFSFNWTPIVNATELRQAGFQRPTTELTVNITNETYGVYCVKTFNLTDDLTVENVTVASGENFYVNGTSTRVNGTQIIVNVTGYNVDLSPPTLPTVQNGEFSTQLTARATTGVNLATGDYTITVNDTLVTATATLTVVSPSIEITEPTEGEKIPTGETIYVNGTTNVAKTVTITITGPEAYSITDTVTPSAGKFSYEWTVPNVAGIYYITAQMTAAVPGQATTKTYADTVSVEATTPANVNIVDFVTEPAEITVGTPFKVNVTLNNTGGVDGTVTVTFKKDGVQFDSKDVTVPAGATAYYVESNETSFDTAGVHNI